MVDHLRFAKAMTDQELLDQFAAAALTGLLSNKGYLLDTKVACEDAYDYAQAMLDERAKRMAREKE